MIINQFKQYLYEGRKILASWSEGIINDDDTYHDVHTTDFYGECKISFLEFDGKGRDIGDFVVPPFAEQKEDNDVDSLSNRFLYYSQYMRILLGEYDTWRLLQVNIDSDYLTFIFAEFHDGIDDLLSIRRIKMEIPPHLKFRMECYGGSLNSFEEEGPMKTYLVTIDTNDNGEPSIEVERFDEFEEPIHDTSRILRDERGLYELITKA